MAFIAQILLCENRDLDPELQSRIITNGEREDSWGLAQIHLPSHPTVSKAMAQNPYFAIDFTVRHVVAGDSHMWTCARSIQKQFAEDTGIAVPPS